MSRQVPQPQKGAAHDQLHTAPLAAVIACAGHCVHRHLGHHLCRARHTGWRAGQPAKFLSLEEEVFRADTKPDIVMECIFILYDAATKTERFKPFRISPFDILQHTIFIYIKGVCTPKGIEELEAHVPTLQPFGKAGKGREK